VALDSSTSMDRNAFQHGLVQPFLQVVHSRMVIHLSLTDVYLAPYCSARRTMGLSFRAICHPQLDSFHAEHFLHAVPRIGSTKQAIELS
jgi:hypothetical protein